MSEEQFRKEIERIIDDVSGGTHNSQEWWSSQDGERPAIEHIVDTITAAAKLFVESEIKKHVEIIFDGI